MILERLSTGELRRILAAVQERLNRADNLSDLSHDMKIEDRILDELDKRNSDWRRHYA